MNSLKLILSHKRYFAPAMVFASLNVLIGTWAIYIPTIKSKLRIDEGELGVAIFFMAIGTLLMIVLTPKIIERLGVGRATALGLFPFLFSFILPFYATDYVLLCIGLFVVGAFSGFTDVAVNTLVTHIEKEDKVHIMSANHGFFSLGGFISAGIGSFFLPLDVLPLNHLYIVIGIMLIINVLFVKYYYRIASSKTEASQFKFKKFKPILVIALIAFFVMASEGAIVDWSALYLEKVSLAKISMIGLGYTMFSATMAFGRFWGDAISKMYGSKTLILWGTCLGILGFAAVIMTSPIIAITGFGLVGLGLSVIIPELFRLGGNTKGIEAAQGISFVSGIGFFGFLVGPVLLGFLAEVSSLKLSFVALLSFIILSFLLALKLKR